MNVVDIDIRGREIRVLYCFLAVRSDPAGFPLLNASSDRGKICIQAIIKELEFAVFEESRFIELALQSGVSITQSEHAHNVLDVTACS